MSTPEHILTKTQTPLQGVFWFPENKNDRFNGVLKMQAGKKATLELLSLSSSLYDDSKKVIHGVDEYGRHITIVKAYSSSHSGKSNDTSVSKSSYDCEALIFRAHISADNLKFHGVKLQFDHLEKWVGRCAFERYHEKWDDQEKRNYPAKLVIPFAKDLSIKLNLDEYKDSDFFCAFTITPSSNSFSLKSNIFLNLTFETAKTWEEIQADIQLWEWFFNLATRTTVEPRYIALQRDEIRIPIGNNSMEPLPVWTGRDYSPQLLHPKRHSHDFHFTFSDIETDFPKIITNWRRIWKPWAPVLHRFHSIASPRRLWVNEKFLFLAQAIEALHYARTGKSKDFYGAAKEAWLNSPEPLQEILGKRGLFIDTLRETRNYWVHYGEPTEKAIIESRDLIRFNEKLRFVIETAILTEIGISADLVNKVYSGQWQGQFVDYD